MLDKDSIRKQMKQQRQALSSIEKQEAALSFLKKLQPYFELLPPQKIAVYLAMQGELDLAPSIEWFWAGAHSLYLPILHESKLQFGAYTKATPLHLNQYGILEPEHPDLIDAQALDYVLMPLVAFDSNRNRLGMGKGYYDRTFAFCTERNKPTLIGCAYSFQEVPMLPRQAHDVRMHLILTSS